MRRSYRKVPIGSLTKSFYALCEAKFSSPGNYWKTLQRVLVAAQFCAGQR
jgi:hypothetical protein